jgi:hypothetical protein
MAILFNDTGIGIAFGLVATAGRGRDGLCNGVGTLALDGEIAGRVGLGAAAAGVGSAGLGRAFRGFCSTVGKFGLGVKFAVFSVGSAGFLGSTGF